MEYICSLERKLNDKNFLNTVNNFDFISFVETKMSIASEIEIPNYSYFHSYRKKKHKNACAHSGGVGILLQKHNYINME